MDVFVARQPIFDRSLQVYGYELLSRSCLLNAFEGGNGTAATVQVIANSVLTIGWSSLLGGKRGFINFGRNVLVGDWTTILPSATLVVEVLESVEPDSEVLDACRSLRKLGYTVALDDFICSQAYEPLTQLADIIKVDFRSTPRHEQARLVKIYGGRGIAMLAEKVETREEFEWAKAIGYTYFQGYFFARPHVVRAKQIPAFKVNHLRLLKALSSRELDFAALEKLIRLDVALAYKILRYINSATFAISGTISSIRQALLLMGEGEIRRWISIATLPSMTQDQPEAIAMHAMVRGRFCETVASHATRVRESGDPFLLGMFSLLDAMIHRPLAEIVNELGLTADLRGAILGEASETNTLAAILKLVRYYEAADWEKVPPLANLIGLPTDIAPKLYLDAIAWSEERMLGNTSASAHKDNKQGKELESRDLHFTPRSSPKHTGAIINPSA